MPLSGHGHDKFVRCNQLRRFPSTHTPSRHPTESASRDGEFAEVRSLATCLCSWSNWKTGAALNRTPREIEWVFGDCIDLSSLTLCSAGFFIITGAPDLNDVESVMPDVNPPDEDGPVEAMRIELRTGFWTQ